MKRSPKLIPYAVVAACLFLVALVLGRPELAALGAPFALILLVGLALPRPSLPSLTTVVGRERALEGESVEAEIVVRSTDAIPLLQLAFSLPDGLSTPEPATPVLLRLGRNEEQRVPVTLVCDRWGAYRPLEVAARSTDTGGLRSVDVRTRGPAVLRVYPSVERLRTVPSPLETQPFGGNQVARSKGAGVEFADIRPYLPGDRPRRINWRATSVRQSLWVNEQRPERNSDVVVFVDNFTEARRGLDGTLGLTVHAAASLIERYLQTGHRVGLVSFGGILRWLAPSTGALQRYRVIEALLETEVTFSFVWRDIGVLPRQCLTPKSLVIALSPLLDERSVASLVDLRQRGFDVVVVEISPLGFAPEATNLVETVAIRFWRLWRDSVRFRLQELGVAVVEWDGRTPLAGLVEEVRAFRRSARYPSASAHR